MEREGLVEGGAGGEREGLVEGGAGGGRGWALQSFVFKVH